MSVSVLIPAFRPTFLGQAIASVLAQGHEDFELIVSDDSGGDKILPVVERFCDPRIRYVKTAGRTGGGENMRGLWKIAQHGLIKYLFDDDLLMPHALGELVDEVTASPEVSFVFGRRQIIDSAGRILSTPPELGAERVRWDGAALAQGMVGNIINPIGEFSNILINRGVGLSEADFLSYRGCELRVVTDVGFFLNASRRGPCAGLNRIVGAFRKHGNQNSSPAVNPWFVLGLCEWEVFARGEYSAGLLPKPQMLRAIDKLILAYANWMTTVPLISSRTPGLVALRQRVEDGETAVLDDEFRGQWAAFVSSVVEAQAPEARPQSA